MWLLTGPQLILQPAVLEEMPPYPEKESSILSKLDKMHHLTDDTSGNKKRVVKELEKVTAAAVSAVSAAAPATTNAVAAIANAEGFERFALLSSGVLYENPVIQIGAKGEYTNNLGKHDQCCAS
jgi:AP-2 complex subunit alpha